MPVRHRFTTRADGDLRVDAPGAELAATHRRVAPGAWCWLRQVHGATAVTVDRPGACRGDEGDALVTATPGVVLSVRSADCPPVLLEADGAVGVVHAGWRGLAAGVLDAAVDALRALDRPPRRAVLGPCIRARCYEFGPADLDRVAAALGEPVRSVTGWGAPALDLAAGVRAACERLDLALTDTGICTACSPNHWSHRARGEGGRHGLVAWLEPAP